MRNLRHAAVVVAIVTVAVAGVVNAAPIALDTPGQSVRVDFNTETNDPGGNWNAMEDPGDSTGGSGLTEFASGSETTVGLVLDTFRDSGQDNAWEARTEAPGWAADDVLNDRFFMRADNTGSVEISGLTAGVAYRIELASGSAAFLGGGGVNGAGTPPGFLKLEDSSGLINAVNGATGDVLTGNDTNNPDWVAWSTNIEGSYGIDGWIVWESATPSGNSLTIDFMTGGGDSRASINAMEISVVPEPATMAMLGIGGLAALLRRRKA